MTGPSRAVVGAAVMLVLLALGGCLTAPAVLAIGSVLATAADAYCNSITVDARQALRDRLTGGRTVVSCVMEDH